MTANVYERFIDLLWEAAIKAPLSRDEVARAVHETLGCPYHNWKAPGASGLSVHWSIYFSAEHIVKLYKKAEADGANEEH